MRIELNSGGLGGYASIATMQSDVTSLLNQSSTVLSALKSVKNYTYNMNGGVGNLQEALNGIETHIQKTECKQSNLNDAKNKINSFIKLVRNIDKNISDIVNKNKEEFYRVNSWAKPSVQGIEGNWYEKVYSWISYIGTSVIEKIQKTIKSFCTIVISVGEAISNVVVPKCSVYDSKKGCYGGNQMVFESASLEEREEYRKIFQKNNPNVNYTDEEFKSYMEKLTDEGCGYVALVNTIFEQYRGKALEFELTFGYPMYKEDGKLNYEALIVDLYSRMDNYDADGSYNANMDYDINEDGDFSSYDYKDDKTGWGTTQYQWKYYLEQFMKEHGASVNAHVENDVHVTADNYNSIISSGKQVIIAFRDGNLYNMDGSVNQVIKGGHAMTVTGVTKDGMLIVSSWGGQYYINPAENGHSQEVRNGDNTKVITQTMSFATVEYR